MILNFKNTIHLWGTETLEPVLELFELEQNSDIISIKEQTVELHGKSIDCLVELISKNKQSRVSMELFYSKELRSLVLDVEEELC